jgi:hypothetical protein
MRKLLFAICGLALALSPLAVPAAASAEVPLNCRFTDDRTPTDKLPKPGVVTVDHYSFGDYYSTHTIDEDGSLGYIAILAHDSKTPVVSVWQNGTSCYGRDSSRNAWAVTPWGQVISESGYSGPIAGHYGDAASVALNRPIVGMSPTSTGLGYWLVASDGGIFAYGDARFFGSTGAIKLNKPITGMSVTPTGNGYWLVASDGGIFAFGDARFFGSTGALTLNRPISGMTATPAGNGYWMAADDGGIFAFGDARFCGSTGNQRLGAPIAGMIPNGSGYTLIGQDGQLYPFPC